MFSMSTEGVFLLGVKRITHANFHLFSSGNSVLDEMKPTTSVISYYDDPCFVFYLIFDSEKGLLNTFKTVTEILRNLIYNTFLKPHCTSGCRTILELRPKSYFY